MKKNIRTRIIGAVLASVCAISAMAAVSTVGASAASIDTRSSVSSSYSYGKPARYTMRGWNWTYSADSTYAIITCDFNYSTATCRFIATGSEPGVTNAVLKAQREDGNWNNVPVRFTVDYNLNVTGKVTGPTYVTSY